MLSMFQVLTGLTSDYNDLFSATDVGYIAASYVTLANWQAGSGKDANSQNGNPLYTSPTTAIPDLHLSSATSPCYTKALAGTGITVDIDNDTRKASPDIGADEIVCPPPPPTSPLATPASICNGSSSTLTASAPGYVIYWYSGSCGGTFVATGSPLVVSPAATTTYYARAYSTCGSCFSTLCVSATVTVSAKSADPTSATATSTTICTGQSTTLSVSGGGGGAGEVIHWYSNSCGGTAIGTGNNLAVLPTTTTNYYVRYEDRLHAVIIQLVRK